MYVCVISVTFLCVCTYLWLNTENSQHGSTDAAPFTAWLCICVLVEPRYPSPQWTRLRPRALLRSGWLASCWSLGIERASSTNQRTHEGGTQRVPPTKWSTTPPPLAAVYEWNDRFGCMILYDGTRRATNKRLSTAVRFNWGLKWDGPGTSLRCIEIEEYCWHRYFSPESNFEIWISYLSFS